MKQRLSLLCGVMLVLGLLMAGVPAFAGGAADGEPYVLTIVDCPEDLDETLPSRKTVQLIDGTLYEVRTYYLGRGKWCFAMEAPEQRRLSAEEARQLLERAATPDDPPLLAVVDCPDDLDETVPSWTVMKHINNTLYKWREHYLGDGKGCIVMESPEHRSLSAHEATLLWEEVAAIGHEPTTPDPGDWVIIDPDDHKDHPLPAMPVLPDDFGPPTEKSYSGEPDTGAPPHRLSPPVVDYSQAGIDAQQERQETLDYIQGETTGGYQPSVVIGEDERVRITLSEIQTYPWNTIGYIESTFPVGITTRGTGFLVKAHTILTAAHVVYSEDRGGYAESVLFAPAQFQSEEGEPWIRPYGYRDAVEVAVNQEYIDVWQAGYTWDMLEHDYAGVFIDQPFTDITDYITKTFQREGEEREWTKLRLK